MVGGTTCVYVVNFDLGYTAHEFQEFVLKVCSTMPYKPSVTFSMMMEFYVFLLHFPQTRIAREKTRLLQK